MDQELREQIDRNTALQFARSSGAGGQNVNKVSTKVIARLEIATLTALSDEERERIRERLANRINKDDELVLHVEEERTQGANRRRAMENLEELIDHALEVEPPRHETKPTRASQRRRIERKKKRGRKKSMRKPPDRSEE
mgnify:CR=1 FL=1